MIATVHPPSAGGLGLNADMFGDPLGNINSPADCWMILARSPIECRMLVNSPSRE
jgi:hypothetical protein